MAEDYSKGDSASGRLRDLEHRHEVAQDEIRELRGAMTELTSEVRALTDAIRGPVDDPEKGLAYRVGRLDGLRRIIASVGLAIVTAGGIGLATLLWRIGVVTAKLP